MLWQDTIILAEIHTRQDCYLINYIMEIHVRRGLTFLQGLSGCIVQELAMYMKADYLLFCYQEAHMSMRILGKNIFLTSEEHFLFIAFKVYLVHHIDAAIFLTFLVLDTC